MLYLVRGIYGKTYQVRMCSWEETYNLLPATRDWPDEKVIFARMFTNAKRARECADNLTRIYSECNKNLKED